MISLTVNGERRTLSADPETPLLWVLRETLGLNGVKFGCGVGACGACTVHVDGKAQRSCSVSVSAVTGAKVVTIEGLGEGLRGSGLHPVQRAWLELQVPQCGYCQAGMIMSVAALLKEKPKPTDAEVEAAITNLCRCGTYPRIKRAIRTLAEQA